MGTLQFLVNYIVRCNILRSLQSSTQNAVDGDLENALLSKMVEMEYLNFNENGSLEYNYIKQRLRAGSNKADESWESRIGTEVIFSFTLEKIEERVF